jgi:hypothetical protein
MNKERIVFKLTKPTSATVPYVPLDPSRPLSSSSSSSSSSSQRLPPIPKKRSKTPLGPKEASKKKLRVASSETGVVEQFVQSSSTSSSSVSSVPKPSTNSTWEIGMEDRFNNLVGLLNHSARWPNFEHECHGPLDFRSGAVAKRPIDMKDTYLLSNFNLTIPRKFNTGQQYHHQCAMAVFEQCTDADNDNKTEFFEASIDVTITKLLEYIDNLYSKSNPDPQSKQLFGLAVKHGDMRKICKIAKEFHALSLFLLLSPRPGFDLQERFANVRVRLIYDVCLIYLVYDRLGAWLRKLSEMTTPPTSYQSFAKHLLVTLFQCDVYPGIEKCDLGNKRINDYMAIMQSLRTGSTKFSTIVETALFPLGLVRSDNVGKVIYKEDGDVLMAKKDANAERAVLVANNTTGIAKNGLLKTLSWAMRRGDDIKLDQLHLHPVKRQLVTAMLLAVTTRASMEGVTATVWKPLGIRQFSPLADCIKATCLQYARQLRLDCVTNNPRPTDRRPYFQLHVDYEGGSVLVIKEGEQTLTKDDVVFSGVGDVFNTPNLVSTDQPRSSSVVLSEQSMEAQSSSVMPPDQSTEDDSVLQFTLPDVGPSRGEQPSTSSRVIDYRTDSILDPYALSGPRPLDGDELLNFTSSLDDVLRTQ